MEAPCATGAARDPDDQCPETRYAPQTAEGLAAWTIVEAASSQLRLSGLGGPVGFDWSALFTFAERMAPDGPGLSAALSDYLTFIEAGAVAGLAKRRAQQAGDDRGGSLNDD